MLERRKRFLSRSPPPKLVHLLIVHRLANDYRIKPIHTGNFSQAQILYR